MKERVFAPNIAAAMLSAALFALLGAVPIAGAGEAPQVFIYTDTNSYRAGDTIEVSLAPENLGEGMSVDVYIGLLTPAGVPEGPVVSRTGPKGILQRDKIRGDAN